MAQPSTAGQVGGIPLADVGLLEFGGVDSIPLQQWFSTDDETPWAFGNVQRRCHNRGGAAGSRWVDGSRPEMPLRSHKQPHSSNPAPRVGGAELGKACLMAGFIKLSGSFPFSSSCSKIGGSGTWLPSWAADWGVFPIVFLRVLGLPGRS